MIAVSASTLSPSDARLPSIVTRPAAISSSQARREPIPADARTFWRRSCSRLGISYLIHVVWEEGCERRQLIDTVQAEFLQEQRRRPVEERTAVRLAATFFDQAPRQQGTHHAVTVDTPDRRDARAGGRLLVRDHGQRLQRGLGQPDLLAVEDELLHVRCEVTPRVQPPASGGAAQFESASLPVVVGDEFFQYGPDLVLGQVEYLGQDDLLDRLVDHEEDRLDRTAQVGRIGRGDRR